MVLHPRDLIHLRKRISVVFVIRATTSKAIFDIWWQQLSTTFPNSCHITFVQIRPNNTADLHFRQVPKYGAQTTSVSVCLCRVW